MKNNTRDDSNLYQETNNILIVDDLPDNLHLLSNILTEESYEVRAALNGRIAIEAVEQKTVD